MRILVLSSCTSHKGGLEVMCLQVAQEMRRRGHEIIVAYGDTGDAYPYFQSIASELHQIDLSPFGLREPFASLRMMWDLVRLSKTQQIDVCFTTNLGIARTTGLLTTITNTPCVFHLGLFYEGPFDRFTDWGIKKTNAAISPNAQAAESWLAAGISRDKIQICPNWTDPDRFRPFSDEERSKQRAALELDIDRPLIAHIGRLSEEKGTPTFLDAALLLAQEGVRFSIALMGRPSDSYQARFLFLLKCLKLAGCKVHWAAEANNPEDYFGMSDIAVVPAIGRETFGLTLLEAMSCANVTIASNANMFPEILGEKDADLLFQPGNVPELANLIRFWISASRDRRHGKGSALRHRVISHYSGKNASVYESVFYRCIHSRRQDPLATSTS